MPPKLLRLVEPFPPRLLRLVGLCFVGLSVLFAIFGGIRLARLLAIRSDPVSSALGGIALDVLFLTLSGAFGNYLWQAGRILGRRQRGDPSP